MKIKRISHLGLFALGLLLSYKGFAQVPIDAKVYVCTDKNGAVTLQNLGARANCKTHVVRVYMNSTPKARFSLSGMPDPQPANGALMAGTKVMPNVQRGRDDARLNPDLKRQLSLTQANVDSLKREISNVRGTNEEPITFVLQ